MDLKSGVKGYKNDGMQTSNQTQYKSQVKLLSSLVESTLWLYIYLTVKNLEDCMLSYFYHHLSWIKTVTRFKMKHSLMWFQRRNTPANMLCKTSIHNFCLNELSQKWQVDIEESMCRNREELETSLLKKKDNLLLIRMSLVLFKYILCLFNHSVWQCTQNSLHHG